MGGSFDRWVARVKAIHDATVKTETLEKDAKGNWKKSSESPDADYYETMFISCIGTVMDALGYDGAKIDSHSIDYDNAPLMHNLLNVYGMAEGTSFVLSQHTLGHGKATKDQLLKKIALSIKQQFGWDFDDQLQSQLHGEVRTLMTLRQDAQEAAKELGLKQVYKPPLNALDVALNERAKIRELSVSQENRKRTVH